MLKFAPLLLCLILAACAAAPTPAESEPPAPSVAREQTATPASSPGTRTPTPRASVNAGEVVRSSPSATPVVEEGSEVGDRAPGFALATLEGSALALDELRGRPVWLAFWASSCVGCSVTLGAMQNAHQRHTSDGLAVVGVSVAEDSAVAGAFAAALELTYPIALDSSGEVFLSYRAAALPAHFWIDGDGIVRGWAFGDVPPDQLEARAAELIAEASP